MLAIVSARFLWLVVVNLEVVSDRRRTKAFRVALHVFGLNTQLMLIGPRTKGPAEARRIPGTPRADTKGPRESTEEAQQKPRETQARNSDTKGRRAQRAPRIGRATGPIDPMILHFV